jgi:hypothetical protein
MGTMRLVLEARVGVALATALAAACMTSPHGTPALGSWRVRDGRLSITEEGRDYPVDVLELGADVFRIRIRGPGEPVEIRFAPAEQVVVPLERSAQP